METIDENTINQAILVSTLTGNPVHITGVWYVWGNTVLPKRLLLLVLIKAHGTTNIAHAGERVMMYYQSIRRCVPEKFRINIKRKQLITDLVQSIWDDINRAVKVTEPITFGTSSFMASFDTDISSEQLRQFILQLWAKEEYDENIRG